MAYLDYDRLSTCYDMLYGEEQREKYREVFKGLQRELGVVLDIGCGTALLLEYMRNSPHHEFTYYIGVDKSIGMLRVAKRRGGAEADLIQADAHHIPLREKSIDKALAITVIHHLEEEKALEEIRRVTREEAIITYHKRITKKQETTDENRSKDVIILVKG